MKIQIGLVFIMAFVACAPEVTRIGYTPDAAADNDNRSIKILKYATIDESLYEQIGTITISDGKFSRNCDEDAVINLLKDEASRISADLVNITNSKQPSSLSKCYQVTAIFYRQTNQADGLGSSVSVSSQP